MKINIEEVAKIVKGELAVLKDLNSDDFESSLSDLGVDSLDRSSMFLDLEESFDVEFSDDDIDNLSSIKDITDFINEAIGS